MEEGVGLPGVPSAGVMEGSTRIEMSSRFSETIRVTRDSSSSSSSTLGTFHEDFQAGAGSCGGGEGDRDASRDAGRRTWQDVTGGEPAGPGVVSCGVCGCGGSTSIGAGGGSGAGALGVRRAARGG